MKKKLLLLTLSITFCLNCITVFAQDDDKKSSFNIGSDIYNRYVWRGLDFGSAPSIQPTLEYAHKSGLKIGSWGAFSTLSNYNEIDLYLAYEFKGISLTFTDYYFPVSGIPALKPEKYFNYNNATTGHVFEGSLAWAGTEKLPLSLLAGVFVYGGDKNANDEQNYSTYLEIAYTFYTKAGELQPFVGFTPAEGLYGNTMGVVNLGLSSSKTIKVTENFEIPVSTSLIFNPQISNVYFLIGFSF